MTKASAKPRKPPSPTVVDLGPKSRPTLAAEFEARGRPLRSHIYGEWAEVIASGEVDYIKSSYWGAGQKLMVTLRYLGDFDAAALRLTNPWPVNDGSQRRAEYRDELVREFLRSHAAGRRIVDEMIRERQAAEQNRTSPSTLPMVGRTQV